MIKNYLYNLFLKRFLRKKLYMIGLSHILSSRKYYSKVSLLSDVDYKIFSQNGEDGILDYLLTSLAIENPKFLEIGVGDFTECNTRFIFDRCSAKGTIIDCINNFEEKVKKNVELWKGDLKIINKKINSENIGDLIENSDCFFNLDIFSLDIDGIDYWIINELPENFAKIVVLEYNPLFGSNLEVTVPNLPDFDRSSYHYSNLCFGMSLKAAINLMLKKNFYFIGTNLFKNNAFFVNKKFLKEKYFNNLQVKSIEDSVNSNFTESRSKGGLLNYLNKKIRIKEIQDCDVINLANLGSEKKKIKDLL
tara:strand:- start:141 stop:1058 length:918 start_codon:yes stop_codon:yes gene_type:complete